MSDSFRSLRHSRCVMAPLSAMMLIISGLFSLLFMVIRMPEFLLSYILAPIYARSSWYIEFLYPSAIARWGHLSLLRMSRNRNKKVDAQHSKTLGQRMEVIPDRVYIHPLPQFIDNIGYLVVCVTQTHLQGFVLDCGDALSVKKQITDIQQYHYQDRAIDIFALFSTHKHHDHTAGNSLLLTKFASIHHVYGGACERVPSCTTPLKNNDFVQLPLMWDGVQLEAIAVPGHTRGSMCYVLRSSQAAFCFTGDTIFSGGGGVPFEADLNLTIKDKYRRGISPVYPLAGTNSVERCFCEVVVRAMPTSTTKDGSNILIFPGHEYTADLIGRQFLPTNNETSQWTKYPPSVFFQAASQFYVTSHRRNLPIGKLLTVPTLMSIERNINPHFRKLKKRGEDIARAIKCWYRMFAKTTIPNEGLGEYVPPHKTPRLRRSTDSNKAVGDYTVAAGDISPSIFTTVYTADFDLIINELERNIISPEQASQKMRLMRLKLNQALIGRRPIPGTLPTEKLTYMAINGLVMLGSAPTALTKSDSVALNIPPPLPPMETGRILISKKRLIHLLQFLGVISDDIDGRDLRSMIEILWKETRDYGIENDQIQYESYDTENDENDMLYLQLLRWMLFGVNRTVSPRWYCMPCGGGKSKEHPINSSKLRRTNGELVKHDPTTCPLCRDSMGCSLNDGFEEMESKGSIRERSKRLQATEEAPPSPPLPVGNNVMLSYDVGKLEAESFDGTESVEIRIPT